MTATPRTIGLGWVGAVAAVVALLAVASTGCGDSDDGPAADRTQAVPAAEPRPDSRSRGGNGEGSSGDGQADAPVLSGDREEAKAGAGAVTDIYDDLRQAASAGIPSTDVEVGDTLAAAADDESLAKVCDLLSDEAKERTIVYARRSAGLADVQWTCENATGLLLRRAKQAGGLRRSTKATVLGVNADGDRATATIRFGGRPGHVTTIPLVKEDGEWKLGVAPGAAR